MLFLFLVNVDDQNDKEVLDIANITVSLFKEANPDDSETGNMIGLSSEDEAEDMSENEYVARKYHVKEPEAPPPPVPPTNPDPEPPVPPIPPPPQVPVTSVQVPISMLQGVHQALGQLLQGQNPQFSLGQQQQSAPTPGFVDPSSAAVPFPIPKVKRTDKVCPICKRSFWAPETFRRHLKTHTGTQHNVCPNEGCGRKLSSKRSLEVHLTTCGVPKAFFCKKKDCESSGFATKAGLAAHMSTHQTLKKADKKCPGCPKDNFTRLKSKKDHWRYCPGNPDRLGPFYCPVPGCHRGAGSGQPFERTRNLNQHLWIAHQHDPKHVKE